MLGDQYQQLLRWRQWRRESNYGQPRITPQCMIVVRYWTPTLLMKAQKRKVNNKDKKKNEPKHQRKQKTVHSTRSTGRVASGWLLNQRIYCIVYPMSASKTETNYAFSRLISREAATQPRHILGSTSPDPLTSNTRNIAGSQRVFTLNSTAEGPTKPIIKMRA